jgi:hypothetical protein
MGERVDGKYRMSFAVCRSLAEQSVDKRTLQNGAILVVSLKFLPSTAVMNG